MPFLENVTRGRDVPRERLLEVAEHYDHLGGISPIQEQARSLIAALEVELREHGHALPIYWGNRNWHPMLDEAVQQMKDDGISHALAFVTSPWSSYSGCRQYLEAIENARIAVGEGAPQVDKIRPYFDHPGFLEAQVERVREVLTPLPSNETPQLLFTAHSIPVSMARTSAYEAQVREASRIVAERAAPNSSWELVWQSRSGPPRVPWLEPDIRDALSMNVDRDRPLVIVPIGFISDHMEVVWDLDHDARGRADELGLTFIRAKTVGTHPLFVRGIRELIEERVIDGPKRSLSVLMPCPDRCAEDCCPAPARKPRT